MLKNPGFLYCFAVAVIISALSGISPLMLGTRAQSNRRTATRRSSANGPIDSDDLAGTFIVTFVNGSTSCRRVSSEEEKVLLHADRSKPMHVISPLSLTAKNQSQTPQTQTGLKIMLRATDQFENFNVKTPFLRAAAHWEQVIKTPITVIIDVDYGPTRFGTPFPAGVIGATSTQTMTNTGSYSDIRNGLIMGATNQSESALYSALPQTAVPTDSGATSTVSATSANLRALGLLGPVANPDSEASLGAPPAIGFNSNFPFDFEPNNGIDAGFIDFDAVVTHEIGHVLGFISNVGAKELTPANELSVTPWDLFRFRPGSSGDFTAAQRILASGGEQIFYNGTTQVGMSTGRPDGSGGDGRQASHWKDDFFGGAYLGILDPTTPSGKRNLITNDDLKVLDLIGYQIDSPTPDNQNQELLVDDGTAEVTSLSSSSDVAVNRLTPLQYPSTLRKIRVFLRPVDGSTDPSGTRIRLVAYADPTRLGITSSSLRPVVDQTIIIPAVGSNGQFVDLDLPLGPTINSGDWYVGYQLPGDSHIVAFAGDTNGTLHNAGFLSFGGSAAFQPLPAINTTTGGSTPANLMIRAVVTSSSCSIILPKTSFSVGKDGGTVTPDVLTGSTCGWEALSTVSWIKPTSSGTGSGPLSLSIDQNFDNVPRSGNVVVGDQQLTINQDGQKQFSSGSGQISVAAASSPDQCVLGSTQITVPVPATALQLRVFTLLDTGRSMYIRFGQPVTGTPPNVVADYRVDGANNNRFTILINPQTTPAIKGGVYFIALSNCSAIAGGSTIFYSVAGDGCPFSISPKTQALPITGGTTSFNIDTLAGCQWNTISFDPNVITNITQSGLGSGQMSVTVGQNFGAARDATITMSFPGANGIPALVEVTQPSACIYSLPVTSITAPAAGLFTGMQVNTSFFNCPWQVNVNNAGISLFTGPTQSGSVNIPFQVNPNTGPPRTLTMTIVGQTSTQTFTVFQEGTCSYSVTPSGQQLAAGGGTGQISVSTTASCAWTAVSNNSFITIDSGGNGTGNGQVSYSVAANPTGSPRSGTITVAGKTFTVDQSGDCGFSIDPTQQSFDSTGGTGSINVHSNGCHWTAASDNTNFITITSGSSGDASGPVGFTVAANNGPARTGTMTIAGKTFVVNQAAPPCFTTLSADSASVQSAGNSVSVQVNAPAGCSYSVISNASYLSISSGNGAMGPSMVTFDVAENTNPEPRAGTVIIAGLTLLVTQQGTNGIHYGDLNLDDKVNVSDLLILANFLAGNTTISVPESADVKLDHKVNVLDLFTLANELAGNIRYLPVVETLNDGSLQPPATPLSFMSFQNSVSELFSDYASTTDKQQSYLFCIWPEHIEQRRKSVTGPGNSSMHYH